MSNSTNTNTVSSPSLYLQDSTEVEKVFARFDANGDGKISSEELLGVMNALGSSTSPQEISQMMEQIDKDKDGFVNLTEFAELCKAGATESDSGVAEVREAFEMYDQDQDGVISCGELHQILTRLGQHCTVQDCEKMIESVDSDGDGSVSFEEFKKMMTNNNK